MSQPTDPTDNSPVLKAREGQLGAAWQDAQKRTEPYVKSDSASTGGAGAAGDKTKDLKPPQPSVDGSQAKAEAAKVKQNEDAAATAIAAARKAEADKALADLKAAAAMSARNAAVAKLKK
jgi:hypothetical protein